MTKPIVAFRDFANAPVNGRVVAGLVVFFFSGIHLIFITIKHLTTFQHAVLSDCQ